MFAILTSILIGCGKPTAPIYYDFINLNIDSVGKEKSVVSAELKYYNPNNYNLQLRRGNIDVYINNQLAGHSNLDSLIVIPKRDTFYLPVKMEVDMKVIAKNALSIFLNNELLIKLDGRARVGRSGVFMTLPIHYEGKQKLSLY